MTRKSTSQRSAQLKPMQPPSAPRAQVASQSTQSWRSGVLLPALASALLLWAAAAPLAWSWVAWLAPLGWLLTCQRERAVGGRGYFALWLSGCVYWLLVLHGIRLAYWPLVFGWLALSLYLAVYIPLFVAATRVMVWRWKWPLIFAAPTAWLGLELIRSHLLTGFAANTLAHTQAHQPLVIQIADQVGGGGIGFVMMTVAAAVLLPIRAWYSQASSAAQAPGLSSKSQVGGAAWALSLLAAMLGYGWWRLAEADRMAANTQPLLRVLLVQENTPSMFDNYSPERNQQAWDAYLETTRQGAAEHGPVDVVVWPESTFTGNEPWVEAHLAEELPAELQRAQVDRQRLLTWISELELVLHFKANRVLSAVREAAQPTAEKQTGDPQETTPTTLVPTASVPAAVPAAGPASWPYLLVGSDVWVYRSDKVARFNSALLLSPAGQQLDRYGKMHLVMFGEYIPLGPLLQWLRDLVGLSGLDAGTEPKSFRVGQVRLAPNICFESMMPHVINAQVRQLVAQGVPPDVLVNLTNDSWFRGSTVLDHHLACSMLCAVENRRPMLVAANTGLSAHIDGSGRLLDCSQRLKADTILAEPHADNRWGLVQWAGYPLSWLCALVTSLALIWPVLGRVAPSGNGLGRKPS